MYFDKDQNLRRQREIAYRNQLKNDIQMKSSQIYSRNQRPSNQKPQKFGLLANIQIQEEARKNKQSSYYTELRDQIEKQKQQKKRKKDEIARRERQQQEKLRRDNEVIRQRHQQQIRKQNRKKGEQLPAVSHPQVQKKLGLQKPLAPIQKPVLSTFQQRLKTSQSNIDSPQASKKSPLFPLPTYTPIQEYPNNFVPQRRYMNSYFQQLLGQRRRFQQETNSFKELNRHFYQEKMRVGRIQTRGLQQMKELGLMLEEKAQDYMAAGNRYDSAIGRSHVSSINSRFNDGFRRLQ